MHELPFVSVVMPVHNEAKFIARSLSSVLAQDYPTDLIEVIVTDGMSDDGTRDQILSIKEHHRNLHLIDNAGRIVSTGLNAALRKSRGEVIVRVDGHCEIDPDYVSKCVQHLLSDGVAGVGGPVETVGETPRAKAIAVAMSSRFGVGGGSFRTERDRTRLVDTVAFPAYARRAIESAGPFDEELVRNQDDEYNYRLRQLGGRILLASDVHSRYYSRSTLPGLWSQYFQYGYWKVRVMQKHPLQMCPRQFLPPAFVFTLLTTALAAPFSISARMGFALTVCLYLLASLAASLLSRSHTGWRLMPFLCLSFSAMHFGYGFGFLWGLIRFWNRWGRRNNSLDVMPKTGERVVFQR